MKPFACMWSHIPTRRSRNYRRGYWLNEQLFAKIKALLRKAAARTFDALIAAIADALATVTPTECVNYLANSGYRHQS
jgi:hypothetical protein